MLLRTLAIVISLAPVLGAAQERTALDSVRITIAPSPACADGDQASLANRDASRSVVVVVRSTRYNGATSACRDSQSTRDYRIAPGTSEVLGCVQQPTGARSECGTSVRYFASTARYVY